MGSESPAAAMDRLESEAATGCLTVGSAARVYLVGGVPVHAETPTLEGNAALTAVLGMRGEAVEFAPAAPYTGRWSVDPDAPSSTPPLPAEWPEDPEVPEDQVRLSFRTADANLGQAFLVLGGLVLLGVVFFLAVNSRG